MATAYEIIVIGAAQIGIDNATDDMHSHLRALHWAVNRAKSNTVPTYLVSLGELVNSSAGPVYDRQISMFYAIHERWLTRGPFEAVYRTVGNHDLYGPANAYLSANRDTFVDGTASPRAFFDTGDCYAERLGFDSVAIERFGSFGPAAGDTNHVGFSLLNMDAAVEWGEANTSYNDAAVHLNLVLNKVKDALDNPMSLANKRIIFCEKRLSTMPTSPNNGDTLPTGNTDYDNINSAYHVGGSIFAWLQSEMNTGGNSSDVIAWVSSDINTIPNESGTAVNMGSRTVQEYIVPGTHGSVSPAADRCLLLIDVSDDADTDPTFTYHKIADFPDLPLSNGSAWDAEMIKGCTAGNGHAYIPLDNTDDFETQVDPDQDNGDAAFPCLGGGGEDIFTPTDGDADWIDFDAASIIPRNSAGRCVELKIDTGVNTNGGYLQRSSFTTTAGTNNAQTLVFWYKHNGETSGTTTGALINIAPGAGTSGLRVRHRNADNGLAFYFGTSGGFVNKNQNDAGLDILDGNAHMIAISVVNDGSDTDYVLFVGRASDGTVFSTTDTHASANFVPQTSGNFSLGAINTTGTTVGHGGWYDTIRVYPEAKTVAELTELFEIGVGGAADHRLKLRMREKI